MQAYQLIAPHQAELRDVPQPEPGPGEVLVRIGGAGACHSDIHILDGPPGAFPVPMTLGHENAGWVAAVGDGVEGWDEGTPVAVYGAWGCGRCAACQVGAENYCREGGIPQPGIGTDGGMTEQLVVPQRELLPLGELDPVSAAPLTDAALTPYHAIQRCRRRLVPNATALVIGVGGLGHLAVQLLRATSAVRIVAVDLDERRLAQAAELGADETVRGGPDAAATVRGLTADVGVDVVLDFVGDERSVVLAQRTVAVDGRIELVGLAGGTVPYKTGLDATLPWGVAVSRPFWGTRPELREVIALAQRGLIRAHVDRFALSDVAVAYERLANGELLGRAVMVPGG